MLARAVTAVDRGSPAPAPRLTGTLRRYARLFVGFRGPLIGFVVVALAQFAFIAPVPFLVKEVFDTALGERRLGLLFELVLMIFVLQLISSLLGLTATSWILRVGAGVTVKLRRQVFDKLYSLSIRFHDNSQAVDIHDRVVHETERVDEMTRSGYAIAVPSMLLIVGIMGILAVINWVMFLITLAFVPLAYLINRVSRNAMRRAARRMHSTFEAFSETAFVALRTMRQTRIAGAEAETRAEQDDVFVAASDAARRHGVRRRAHIDANRIAVAIWVVVILLVGGVGVIDRTITVGDLFSFYAGIALMRGPIDQLIFAIASIVEGQEALVRVFELLDIEDPRPYTGTRPLVIDGRLSVDGVWFDYGDGPPVLRDVSLRVDPGEVVALVGANGSGKTTLLNLIVGFYRPSSGWVSMDGVGYDDLEMGGLRRQLGVLTQDPVMVPGTVRENIVYGRSVSEDDLRRAIDLAGATGLIRSLESGLDTRAYESGPLLSGGQLQRIALARALLGRPRLVILDEPSTHLDIEGVSTLLDNLHSFSEPPAMIIITHDPGVAAVADRVLRLDNGVLVPA